MADAFFYEILFRYYYDEIEFVHGTISQDETIGENILKTDFRGSTRSLHYRDWCNKYMVYFINAILEKCLEYTG